MGPYQGRNGWPLSGRDSGGSCRVSSSFRVVSVRYLEGYVEYERIAQHVSNIRAINFGSNPIPKGIENYLKEQIAFIRKMVGTCSSSPSLPSQSPEG